jgi:hypothetical protein
MRGVFRDRFRVCGCPCCLDGNVIATTPTTTQPNPTHADADSDSPSSATLMPTPEDRSSIFGRHEVLYKPP